MKPTWEQMLEWARESGLKCAANYDYRGAYEKMDLSEKQDLDKTLIALTLAYAQGRKDENEAIAKMIEDAPPLIDFAKNEQGGCVICGFTPKLATFTIRERMRHE